MEYSCYYYHSNSCYHYFIFVKKDDVVYVETPESKTFITYEMLTKNENLKRYYETSKELTEDITKLNYCEGDECWGHQENTENKWFISAKINWKSMYITEKFTTKLLGFETNPEDWEFTLSSPEEIKELENLMDDPKSLFRPHPDDMD